MIAPFGLLVEMLNCAGNTTAPAEPSSRKAAVAEVAVTDFAPDPSCVASVMRSEPLLMLTVPVKLLLPVSATTSVSAGPLMNSAPAPLMSFATSTMPVRSIRKVAPLATLTAPLPSVPVAPSLPICSVPALIVVGPV